MIINDKNLNNGSLILLFVIFQNNYVHSQLYILPKSPPPPPPLIFYFPLPIPSQSHYSQIQWTLFNKRFSYFFKSSFVRRDRNFLSSLAFKWINWSVSWIFRRIYFLWIYLLFGYLSIYLSLYPSISSYLFFDSDHLYNRPLTVFSLIISSIYPAIYLNSFAFFRFGSSL